MLLGEVESPALPSLTSLVVYGPLGILFAVFIYFLVRWGDKWMSGQVTMMTVMADCTKSNTDNLTVLTESVKVQVKVPRMLCHIAEAAKAATSDPEVKRHLDRVIDEHERQ